MFNSAFQAPFRALFNAAAGVVYLLRDEFTTAEAAPLASPRACEPGPGTWNITDTTSKLSISGGKLVQAALTGPSSLLRTPSTISRSLRPVFKIVITTNFVTTYVQFGFGNNEPFVRWDAVGITSANNLFAINNASLSPIVKAGLSINTTYKIYIIQRSAGAFYIIDNKLLYVTHYGAGSFYPSILTDVPPSGWSSEKVAVASLVPGWDSDISGIAYQDATPTAGDIATSTNGNTFSFITWTVGAGETLEIKLRWTDDDNCWVVRCNQSTSTIKLIERNAGIETERSSAAQTWTPTSSYIIDIQADNNTIRSYVNEVGKSGYALASFNNTANSIKIIGFISASGWNIFDVDLSAPLLGVLEAI